MAAIVFQEEQPGILTIANPVDIGWVLAAEVLLDFSIPTQNCDLIKGDLNISPMTDDTFQMLISQLAQEESIVNVDDATRTFGPATEISTKSHRLSRDDLHEMPYSFTINLFGEENRDLREMVQGDQWIENEGVLPITNPLWDSITTPEFSIFGVGSKGPLTHEKHQLGLVYCVLKGRQTFTVIRKGATTTRMNADLRRRLQGTRFPQEILQCPNWLQHASLYYEPEFLRDNYDAKTVELTAGQFVIFQSGVHFQIESIQAGFSVSYSCAPRTWQTAQNIGECEHMIDVLTLQELNKARENAGIVKNLVARTLLLNANGPTRAIINVTPRVYPQRVAIIHDKLGQNSNNGGGANNHLGEAVGGVLAAGRIQDVPGHENEGENPVLQQFPDEAE